MYYDEYGSRNSHTILLLHGAGVTDTFAHQYQALSGYHLVVPHLFGSGQETGELYASEKACDAVLQIIQNLDKSPVSVVGHSLGAQLAVALVSQQAALFDRAVFLSPWVCPTEASIYRYEKLAGPSAWALQAGWLVRMQARYWGFTSEQADFMAAYSRKITRDQYAAWFVNPVRLSNLSGYPDAGIPMLAVCGSREIKEMKHSVTELSRLNPRCRTLILPSAGHDYPMRQPEILNQLLTDFLS